MSDHTPMQESTMRLDQLQLDRYRHDGYLGFPGLLSPDEVAVLDADVPMLQSDRQQEDYFYETEQTGYALHSLTPDALDKLTTEHPPVPLTGTAGTVVFFDCLLPHCSGEAGPIHRET